MLKTEFRRAIRIGIGLRPESLLQGAHWAECAVVRQQRTTNRASSFALDCRHRMLLATRILLYLAPMACGKIARDRRLVRGIALIALNPMLETQVRFETESLPTVSILEPSNF